MLRVILVIGGIISAAAMIVCWSLCAISGRCSRWEERMRGDQ